MKAQRPLMTIRPLTPTDLPGIKAFLVEKDAVRLIKFRQELEEWPFYVLPITPRFLFGEEAGFRDIIIKFITEFQKNEE